MDLKNLSKATVGTVFIALGVMLPNAAWAASLTFITTRTNLGVNDSVDWEVGSSVVKIPTNPFSVKSSGGLELTMSKASGSFQTARQSSASDGLFSGNFAPSDNLIATGRQSPGPVTIAFSSPVLGAGTQVESFNNGSFDAIIEALDSFGNILGSFSIPAIANYGGSGDNTDPFVGVLSDSANIASLRINGERAPGVGFAFNRLDMVSKSVPEPSFSGLSAIAFMGFFGAKRVFLTKE